MGNYERITDEDRKAFEVLRRLRWPERIICPKCTAEDASFNEGRLNFQCRSRKCRYQFSVTSKTKLHNFRLPLGRLLPAIIGLHRSAHEKGAAFFQLDQWNDGRIGIRLCGQRGNLVKVEAKQLRETLGTSSIQTIYRVIYLMEEALEKLGCDSSLEILLCHLLCKKWEPPTKKIKTKNTIIRRTSVDKSHK